MEYREHEVSTIMEFQLQNFRNETESGAVPANSRFPLSIQQRRIRIIRQNELTQVTIC